VSIELALTWLLTILAIFALLCAGIGWRRMATAGELRYFSMRRERVRQGWVFILMGLSSGLLAVFLLAFGRALAFRILPPTPTITPTPSLTPTPTITTTPSITPTPAETLTPTATLPPTTTPTPSIPEALRAVFRDTITPGLDAAFSPLQVSRELSKNNQAVEPETNLVDPPSRLYAAFTYDNLQDGVRWTALWLRDGVVVCAPDTKPWDGGTGGYGYTECEPADGWVPGTYEIQMFWGESWKVSTRFVVEAISTATPEPASPPTPSPSP
jgi:type VI secretion system secreted protein VgrG